jgi:hypothetical protein
MDASLETVANDQTASGRPEAAGGVSRRGRKRGEANRTNGGKRLFCRVLPEEHADIARRAAEAGLTISEFIRRVTTGHTTYTRYDYDVFEKLVAVHADMNRLGKLFKMALGNPKDASGGACDAQPYEWMRLHSTLASIESTSELLRNQISEFKT